MIIKNGVTFIWTGTNASIPSGWSRVTGLDGNFPKGSDAGVDPNGTGGAATHTHTSPSHTHGLGTSHAHTITFAGAAGTAQGTGNSSDGAQIGHVHANLASGALTSGSVSSVAATYGACSNNPPYYTVIYITPTADLNSGILPAEVIGLADAAAPSGFFVCDGNNSTPNLVALYLPGAAGGANAGGTGGSTSNTHALSHTHTTSHTHVASTSAGPSTMTADIQTGSNTGVGSHTHSVTLNAATPSTADTVSLTPSEVVEPAYTKLLAIYSSASQVIPKKIIALWLGTLANIPHGWVLCDGTGGTIDMRSRHLKITATVGEVGNTGGSNTHTHAAQAHNHVISHNHTASAATHSGAVDTVGSSPNSATKTGATHALSTDNQNLTLDNANTTADSSNNEPLYRTVAFIKLIKFLNKPDFLQNFILQE